MSLLLEAGHPDAIHYPLGRLNDESNLVIERANNRIITEAQLAQLAVASILSAKARKAFTENVNRLNVTSKPIDGLFD